MGAFHAVPVLVDWRVAPVLVRMVLGVGISLYECPLWLCFLLSAKHF